MEWNELLCYVVLRCVVLRYVTLCYVMLSLSLFIAISYHYVMLCYLISRHVMLCYLMYGRLSTQDNSQALGTMFHAPSESWRLKVHPTIWYMKPISGEFMWIGAKQNQCKSWMFFDISNFSMIWRFFFDSNQGPHRCQAASAETPPSCCASAVNGWRAWWVFESAVSIIPQQLKRENEMKQWPYEAQDHPILSGCE